MKLITLLLEVLAEHEATHEVRPGFMVSTLTKGQASAKCNSCNQHFGFKA